jgi:hypothetical protein
MNLIIECGCGNLLSIANSEIDVLNNLILVTRPCKDCLAAEISDAIERYKEDMATNNLSAP